MTKHTQLSLLFQQLLATARRCTVATFAPTITCTAQAKSGLADQFRQAASLHSQIDFPSTHLFIAVTCCHELFVRLFD